MASEPLVRFRARWGRGARWEEVLLPPEPQQMGETRSGFRPSAHRRPWQGAEIALDERRIHVGNGIIVLGQPPPKLIAGAQRAPATVWGIPVLVQGGGEG